MTEPERHLKDGRYVLLRKLGEGLSPGDHADKAVPLVPVERTADCLRVGDQAVVDRNGRLVAESLECRGERSSEIPLRRPHSVRDRDERLFNLGQKLRARGAEPFRASVPEIRSGIDGVSDRLQLSALCFDVSGCC